VEGGMGRGKNVKTMVKVHDIGELTLAREDDLIRFKNHFRHDAFTEIARSELLNFCRDIFQENDEKSDDHNLVTGERFVELYGRNIFPDGGWERIRYAVVNSPSFLGKSGYCMFVHPTILGYHRYTTEVMETTDITSKKGTYSYSYSGHVKGPDNTDEQFDIPHIDVF
jgi:hypothetical protein